MSGAQTLSLPLMSMSVSFVESDAPHLVHISWSGLFCWPHSGQVVLVESMVYSFVDDSESDTSVYANAVPSLNYLSEMAACQTIETSARHWQPKILTFPKAASPTF